MGTFRFKCPATETQWGHAYFEVEAATESEARVKLAADSAEYYYDFSENDGGTEWHADKPEDWERVG